MKICPLNEYIALLRTHGLLTDQPLSELPLERTVKLVSCDSQQVQEGTLFVVKGAHFRPEYLRQAAEKGAFCYVAEAPVEGADLPFLPVTQIRPAMARLAAFFYEDAWKSLNVIGITGTKGKSTTTYYMTEILNRFLGHRTGVISSIDTYDGVSEFESHLTTPEPLDLHRHFANAKDTGLEHVTMEVSSQALKYDRVLGVDFSAACFLNIDDDHISPVEHPDFEDYFQSKLRLFEQCRLACINLDSQYSQRVLEAASHADAVLTFSQKDPAAHVFASNVRKEDGEIRFLVRTPRYTREMALSMPGLFNVQNALAAITLCEGLGISEETVYDGLKHARVPGRMEVFQSEDGIVTALVDYAHNRLSFETLFRAVKEEYPGKRVVAVFGCPGGKAYDRRRDMGEIAARYADEVILTEDDPGEEPVDEICREIAQYVKPNCPCSMRMDRGSAIGWAIMGARVPTVAVIAGKGADTCQKRGLIYVKDRSDMDYVAEALTAYNEGSALHREKK